VVQPGLTDEERFIGTTHHVEEYIGPELLPISISFVDPSELGFDTSRFAAAGIVAHACGRVRLRTPSCPSSTASSRARRQE
jgi:2,4-diacetylphloroglucinol hydrolase